MHLRLIVVHILECYISLWSLFFIDMRRFSRDFYVFWLSIVTIESRPSFFSDQVIFTAVSD